MSEFVRLFSGSTHESMNIQNWKKHAEIRTGEEAPGEGWYLVQKQEKPVLQPGQILGWTYRIDVEDGVAYKEYFVWEEAKDISKRKLMNNLKAENLWTLVKGFMEQHDIWEDFALATTLDSNDPLLEGAVTQLVAAGITDKETLDRIINSSIAD